MTKKSKIPVPIEHLSELATAYALEGNWDLAIKTNKEIVTADKENTDALNRLGFALTETGKSKEASTYFRKVLRIDPYNSIATKNLRRAKNFKGKNKGSHKNGTTLRPEGLFLEEPGRTATVPLVSLAEPKILFSLNCADPVNLVARSHQIAIVDQSNRYIGKLPDDLAARLLKLIKGGNHYEGWLKSIHESQVHIFLREVKRAKRFESIHSFPIEDKYSYISFTPPDLVHAEQPEMRPLEEQDSPEPVQQEEEEEN